MPCPDFINKAGQQLGGKIRHVLAELRRLQYLSLWLGGEGRHE